jgi:long-chain acyl-CoA synthetase
LLLFSIEGRTRTHGEVADRVSRFAGGMVNTLKIEQGARVAIIASNSDNYFEYFFACPWAGALVVPVNIRLAPPEMIEILSDCDASVIVVDDAFAKIAPELKKGIKALKHVIFIGDGPTPEGLFLSYLYLILLYLTLPYLIRRLQCGGVD